MGQEGEGGGKVTFPGRCERVCVFGCGYYLSNFSELRSKDLRSVTVLGARVEDG